MDISSLSRKAYLAKLRTARKACFQAFRDVGCGEVMPRITFGKAYDICFDISNANIKLPAPGLFSRIKSLTPLAGHEGTHARQYSDFARYYVAKEGGDVKKGMETFKICMGEKGYHITDDRFYRASIERKPPMKVGSKEWKKTEYMMKFIVDYNSFDFEGGLKIPQEVEANLNTAKKMGIPLESLYKKFIKKLGGMDSQKWGTFWSEVCQVIDKLA